MPDIESRIRSAFLAKAQKLEDERRARQAEAEDEAAAVKQFQTAFVQEVQKSVAGANRGLEGRLNLYVEAYPKDAANREVMVFGDLGLDQARVVFRLNEKRLIKVFCTKHKGGTAMPFGADFTMQAAGNQGLIDDAIVSFLVGVMDLAV